MSGETGEKTEEATPEKLRKAKEEGQVPKSQDFVGAMGFAAGFFALVGVLNFIMREVKNFTVNSLAKIEEDPGIPVIVELLADSIPLILKVSLPAATVVFIMGIFSNVMQTGFFLAFKVLNPKLDKINPINGLKGLFKIKKFVELIKNMIKMGVAAWLAYSVMKNALYDMSLTVTLPLSEGVAYSSRLLFEYLTKTAALFVFIGVIDMLWSKKQFAKEQMMSKYDVKQEYKQSEGDPQMKGQRKQLAQELLFGGGGEAVKNSDAVVVNPAHIAVAIKYDGDEGEGAPKVVAKGMRIHAERIKEIAKQYGVPILRNVPLAQALHKLDIDEEIPEELYEAVAEVLSFVYKLKEEQEARHKEQREQRAQAYRAQRKQGLLPASMQTEPEEREAPGGLSVGGSRPSSQPGNTAPASAPKGADRLRGRDRLKGKNRLSGRNDE